VSEMQQQENTSLRYRTGSLNKSMDVLFPQESDNQCRVCREPVVDGRWNYCSERCRDIANAVQEMFLWDKIREQVKDRDDHTCQMCGESLEMRKRTYWQISERVDELRRQAHPKKSDNAGASMDRWRRAGHELRGRYGRAGFTNGWLHVDHITPVSKGGHPFDESNLQTLCRDCHEQKTAEEHSRSEPEQRPEITLSDYMES